MVLSLLQSGVDNQRDAPSPTKWWCTVSFKVEWTIIHALSPTKWSGQSYVHCLLQSGVDNQRDAPSPTKWWCTFSYIVVHRLLQSGTPSPKKVENQRAQWTVNMMHRLLQSGGAVPYKVVVHSPLQIGAQSPTKWAINVHSRQSTCAPVRGQSNMRSALRITKVNRKVSKVKRRVTKGF